MGQIAQRVLRALGLRKAVRTTIQPGRIRVGSTPDAVVRVMQIEALEYARPKRRREAEMTTTIQSERFAGHGNWEYGQDATRIEGGPISGTIVNVGGLSAITANIGGPDAGGGPIKPD